MGPFLLSPSTLTLVRYKSTRVFAWNPSKKRSELFHRTSRFLVVYPEGKDVTTLIAFAMFRFEQEDDADGRPQDVSYW